MMARKENDIVPQTFSTARGTGILSYLSLFGSVGTLLCCALPSLLVLLGLGATVASFLSFAPWMVTLSRHKELVFTLSGLLLGMNFVYVYAVAPRFRARAESCPPDAPEQCETANQMSKVVLWWSATIYLIGFFGAFVLGPILFKWFD